MVDRSNIESVEEYLVDLISQVNPYNASTQTNKLIVLTCLDNKNIEKTIPFINKGFKVNNKGYPTLPTVSYTSKDRGESIVNAQGYFFSSPSNKHPNLSLVNLMYFLTFYNDVKIMIVIEEEDIFNSKLVIEIIKSLSDNLNSKYKGFVECIGIAVSSKAGGNHTVSNYNDELKKIKRTDLSPEALVILDSLTSKNKIIKVTENESEKDFAKAVNTSEIMSFKTSPKVLTQFYEKGLQQSCLESLKSKVFSDSNSYEAKIKKLIKKVEEQIKKDTIFSEDESKRKESLKELIGEDNPFKNVTAKTEFLSKEGKKIVQFSIQGAMLIFAELEKVENDFYEKDQKEPYTKLNISNDDKVDFSENDILNQSLMGVFLSIFFNENTIFYSKEMIGLSKYLHIFLRIFENFPGANIRENEKNLMNDFGRIMTKTLVEYFNENLKDAIVSLTENKDNWKIEAKRLLSLTKDVFEFQKRLKKMKSNDRDPYKSAEIQPKQILEFKCIYFFLSEKCFEVYKEVWKDNKKNKFMSDTLILCQDKNLQSELFENSKEQTLKILRRAHQHLGEWCLKHKKHYFALSFFFAAKSNSKVIETCRQWLQKMLSSKLFVHKDIKELIEKLFALGLIEEAREWCYKFIDENEENSYLLSLLDDSIDYNRTDNRRFQEEIEKLKHEEIFVIEKGMIENLRTIPDFEWREWLEYIDEFSN